MRATHPAYEALGTTLGERPDRLRRAAGRERARTLVAGIPWHKWRP